MSGINAEKLREQFEIESQQGRYSTEGKEPIENNGAFNDAYVEWLEQKLANGVDTEEKQCNLPVVSGSAFNYKKAFELAMKYIDESPCDPDITEKQQNAWIDLRHYVEQNS